jgi:hypothetical protein
MEMTVNVIRAFTMMAYIPIANVKIEKNKIWKIKKIICYVKLATYHAKHAAVVILTRVPVVLTQIY